MFSGDQSELKSGSETERESIYWRRTEIVSQSGVCQNGLREENLIRGESVAIYSDKLLPSHKVLKRSNMLEMPDRDKMALELTFCKKKARVSQRRTKHPEHAVASVKRMVKVFQDLKSERDEQWTTGSKPESPKAPPRRVCQERRPQRILFTLPVRNNKQYPPPLPLQQIDYPTPRWPSTVVQLVCHLRPGRKSPRNESVSGKSVKQSSSKTDNDTISTQRAGNHMGLEASKIYMGRPIPRCRRGNRLNAFRHEE